ncbi:UvrD-helicase domain-containing protein [Actinotignum sp. GS-2025a]|uniref:UvrD-helicase domain-containing protein n=1 Tax=unclassified Actinotignum TaxID=2632702 RepID=UPI003F46342A
MEESYKATIARLRERVAAAQQAGATVGRRPGVPAPAQAAESAPTGQGGAAAAGAPAAASVPEVSGAAARILTGLNSAQREAVIHSGGPLLVVAGAGSGKTRVLTSRIAYLIATGQAHPANILAITFTNKAAREMRERLEGMLGGLARGMWISTFHSACVRILRAEHRALGMRSTFTIYDAADSQRLMTMVCREENIDIRAYPPKMLSRQVSNLKDELVTPAAQAAAATDRDGQVLAQAYAAYQDRLERANALDFDDLIMRTVEVLTSHPEIAERYRTRFRHILVDEYQDTNHAQYVLVRTLAGQGPERSALTVVGDADQSIYAFRGATIRNIEDFEKDFADATSVVLEQNYRSTQNILSAANAVISHNEGRRPKKLWTDSGSGEKITGYVADSESDEANFVVTEIDRLRDNNGVRYGDVAVFYRTNSQARALEEMFVRSGIPYRVIGGTRFYERKEIKDALAYLHAVANPDDTVSLRRIINEPKRGVGDTAQGHLATHAQRWNISFGAAVADVATPNPERGEVAGLTARARSAVADLARILETARQDAAAGGKPADILDYLMDESGYLAVLQESKDPQDLSRVENLAELHAVAVEFSAQNPDAGLGEWLDQISLVSDTDRLPEGSESEGETTLMTVHTAKGLEFPVVFVTGLEDGTFPHMRSLDDRRELAEERRLAYVAFTRARERLYISRAAARSSWGAPQEFPPSRFIEEIPPELIDWRREQSSQDLVRGGGIGSGYGWGRRERRAPSFFDDDAGPIIGSGTFKPGKLGVPATANSASRADSAGSSHQAAGGSGGAAGSTSAAGAPSAADTAADTKGFAVGDTVEHRSFGRGTILGFEGRGKSTTAKVAFGSVTKRLMLRFAPLTKVEK